MEAKGNRKKFQFSKLSASKYYTRGDDDEFCSAPSFLSRHIDFNFEHQHQGWGEAILTLWGIRKSFSSSLKLWRWKTPGRTSQVEIIERRRKEFSKYQDDEKHKITHCICRFSNFLWLFHKLNFYVHWYSLTPLILISSAAVGDDVDDFFQSFLIPLIMLALAGIRHNLSKSCTDHRRRRATQFFFILWRIEDETQLIIIVDWVDCSYNGKVSRSFSVSPSSISSIFNWNFSVVCRWSSSPFFLLFIN